MGIPARISIVTLGVRDLDRSRAFYEALGWELASSSMPEEIVWFRTADSYLGLFGFDALAQDANVEPGSGQGFNGVTLAICMESEHAVSDAFDQARALGATVLKDPVRAEWGGFSGYIADPDGYAWEIAYNPNFPVGEDGRITIP